MLLRHAMTAGLFSIALLLTACGTEEVRPKRPLPQVRTVTVAPQTIPASWSFVAQTESSRQVDILARVSGYLEEIGYREGALIREGALLFRIDAKPYQAKLDAAKGELLANQARLTTARANYERVQPLARQKAVSQADLDRARGEFESSAAAVAVGQAKVQEAELELGYTRITSPVTGYAGRALQREGAFINAQSAESRLTYVAATDPLWINFSISQNQWSRLQQQTASGEIVPPEQQNYVVRLRLADGTIYPHQGHLNFAEPSLSQETGSFLVRAEVPNPNNALKPGMFLSAVVEGAQMPATVLLPKLAVQQGPKGHFVYVIRQDNVAEVRPVVLGDAHGLQETIVRQGLAAGERVVVEGALKVIAGVPVQVREDEGGQTAPVARP